MHNMHQCIYILYMLMCICVCVCVCVCVYIYREREREKLQVILVAGRKNKIRERHFFLFFGGPPRFLYTFSFFILISLMYNYFNNIMVTRLPHYQVTPTYPITVTVHQRSKMLQNHYFSSLYILPFPCSPATLCVLIVMPHFPLKAQLEVVQIASAHIL